MRLYHLVATDPPTARDFLSLAAQGKPAPLADPVAAGQWDGLSTYTTPEQCRELVRKTRGGARRWRYIAALDLPVDGPFRIRQTERKPGDGHHTVWGAVEEFMQCVGPREPV